jgi:hypothetical protein
MNGLIGCGEVGSAIERLYITEFGEPEFLRVDDAAKGRNDDVAACEIIHVAVPAEFVGPVVTNGPETGLYVVHSTVVPGTCRELSNNGKRVVHAPVEGRHPNLEKDLSDWRMPLTGERDDVHEALPLMRRLGIPAQPWVGPWEVSELAKQMSTLRLGLDVLFMRHVYELAAVNKVDGDKVYSDWTEAYNTLYGLSGGKFQRPLLAPMDGPIGGHCVVSNAKTMQELSWFATQVAEMGTIDWKNPCGSSS